MKCWRSGEKKTSQDQGREGTKFKVIDQNILSQVDATLLDNDRVKRKAHGVKMDETTYDDAKFYQQLLKEFVEHGNTSKFSSEYRTGRQARKKKLVDRKASKGRKLRYVVHPKLENYMFPVPRPHVESDELFRSLFGQRVTVTKDISSEESSLSFA